MPPRPWHGRPPAAPRNARRRPGAALASLAPRHRAVSHALGRVSGSLFQSCYALGTSCALARRLAPLPTSGSLLLEPPSHPGPCFCVDVPSRLAWPLASRGPRPTLRTTCIPGRPLRTIWRAPPLCCPIAHKRDSGARRAACGARAPCKPHAHLEPAVPRGTKTSTPRGGGRPRGRTLGMPATVFLNPSRGSTLPRPRCVQPSARGLRAAYRIALSLPLHKPAFTARPAPAGTGPSRPTDLAHLHRLRAAEPAPAAPNRRPKRCRASEAARPPARRPLAASGGLHLESCDAPRRPPARTGSTRTCFAPAPAPTHASARARRWLPNFHIPRHGAPRGPALGLRPRPCRRPAPSAHVRGPAPGAHSCAGRRGPSTGQQPRPAGARPAAAGAARRMIWLLPSVLPSVQDPPGSRQSAISDACCNRVRVMMMAVVVTDYEPAAPTLLRTPGRAPRAPVGGRRGRTGLMRMGVPRCPPRVRAPPRSTGAALAATKGPSAPARWGACARLPASCSGAALWGMFAYERGLAFAAPGS